MRLRSRTGTALTLACLLVASAQAQAPGDGNNSSAPSTSANNLHAAPLEVEQAANRDAIDSAHEAYVRRSDLQLQRPEWDAPPPEPPKPLPGWLRWIAKFLNSLGPIFQILFYAIVVMVVAGVLYFIFGEAIRIRFGKSGAGKVKEGDDVLVDVRPDAAMARGLLEEADALARAGKFAEAVHLLLFRSIEDIQTRLEGGVPKSLTAREIGDLRHLPERARRGLNPIIAIVEASFFGGRDVDADSWKAARTSYEDFAFGEGWS